MSPPERAALASAWRDALPDLVRRWQPNFLRVRVDTPKTSGTCAVWSGWTACRRAFSGLPGKVELAGVALALQGRCRARSDGERVAHLPAGHRTPRHRLRRRTLDPAGDYDIVFVDAAELPDLSADTMSALTDAACVIMVGNDRAEMLLADLESRLEPPIAVAFSAPPDVWWRTFFHTLTHDVPVDAAVEYAVVQQGWTRCWPAHDGARHHRLRTLVRRRGTRVPRACGGPGRVPLLGLGLRE